MQKRIFNEEEPITHDTHQAKQEFDEATVEITLDANTVEPELIIE